jgi:DNA-binding NtrC family response regulator
MSSKPVVLICDDDPTFHLTVQYCCESKYQCLSAANTDEASEILKNHEVDILLLDIKIRTLDEGLRYIPVLKASNPDLAILVISGSTDFSTVRDAMKLGAWDYISKTFEEVELLHTLEQAIERKKLLQLTARQSLEAETLHSQYQWIGVSKFSKDLEKLVERVKRSNSDVLITGETGTGKELVAKLLRSRAADHTLTPFSVVDCALIHSENVETLLFGEERQSPTGSRQITKGVFEATQGGIVYLDEISSMPPGTQVKLLRVLQEKELLRKGSIKPIKIEFRVISSTSQDIEQLIKERKFSNELYQRLNAMPIHIPALRERTEDIPALLEYFVKKLPASLNHLKITPETLQILSAYSWPGNVRELSNFVAYMSTLMEPGSEVDVSDLPPKFRSPINSVFKQTPVDSNQEGSTPPAGFYATVAQAEKEYLTKEYARANGNISKMAMNIGMDRTYLYTKLREHKLYMSKKES